jgi:thioredoxin-related protein
MKNARIIFFVLFGLVLSGFPLHSENKIVGFEWKDFSDASPKAAKEKKHLVINFYSTGCGWCKRMDNVTFGDTAIARQLSASFVGVKINTGSNRPVIWKGQTITERELSRTFKVNGTPNTSFVDTSGNIVAAIPGFVPPDKFALVLKYIAGYWYKDLTFQEFLVSEDALKKQGIGQ